MEGFPLYRAEAFLNFDWRILLLLLQSLDLGIDEFFHYCNEYVLYIAICGKSPETGKGFNHFANDVGSVAYIVIRGEFKELFLVDSPFLA